MIVIPRGLARSFPAVARKCQMPRSRGPTPSVQVSVNCEGLKLAAILEGVILTLEVPQVEAAERTLMVPMDVFDAVDGAPLELTASGRKGTARWESREGPRTLDFDALPPGKVQDLPATPGSLQPVAPSFLSALHECGRTAAKEGARLALHRIQVHGKAGRVVATDGKQALLWNGFRLPFQESVLIPALPVFGAKDLGATTDRRLGRTRDHLVLQAGAWSLWLPIDTTGTFPDVESVLPRARDISLIGLEERDAAHLLAALADLPPAEEETHAVTLDSEGGVRVRARDAVADRLHEIRLRRSTFAGPPVRVAVDRRALARALALGCVSLRLIPGKPMVAEGPHRTFVAVTLEACHIVAPETTIVPVNTVPISPTKPERNRLAMKPSERDGHGPPKPEVLSSIVQEPLDPLLEAEALRASLMETLNRVGRLIQCLKQFHRQRRVLQTTWNRVSSLNTGGTGGDS